MPGRTATGRLRTRPVEHDDDSRRGEGRGGLANVYRTASALAHAAQTTLKLGQFYNRLLDVPAPSTWNSRTKPKPYNESRLGVAK